MKKDFKGKWVTYKRIKAYQMGIIVEDFPKLVVLDSYGDTDFLVTDGKKEFLIPKEDVREIYGNF